MFSLFFVFVLDTNSNGNLWWDDGVNEKKWMMICLSKQYTGMEFNHCQAHQPDFEATNPKIALIKKVKTIQIKH